MTENTTIGEITVRIGKAGINDAIITEIGRHLKMKKLVKVKFLPSAMENQDKKKMAQKIAALCDAILVKRVGFVVVLKR